MENNELRSNAEVVLAKVKDQFKNEIGLIDEYLDVTSQSRVNWLNNKIEAKKPATYALNVLSSKNLKIAHRPSPSIIMFVDSNNIIHIDAEHGGLKGHYPGYTSDEFRNLYRIACYVAALEDLCQMQKSGELNRTFTDTKTKKEVRVYKTMDTLLYELDDSFMHNLNVAVYTQFVAQLRVMNATQLDYSINQWLTFEDLKEDDLNFKTFKNVSHAPYLNPIHMPKPTAKDKRMVDRVFDVYFDKQDRDYMYNWLGAALMNIPQKDIQRLLIIHGEPGVGKSRFMNDVILDTFFPGYHQKATNFAGMFSNGERFATKALRNRRVTFFDEATWCSPKATKHSSDFEGLNVAALKTLIMDGLFTSEVKNGETNTEDEITSLLIASTNEIPSVPIDDNRRALERRLLLLNMKETPGETKQQELNMNEKELSAYVRTNIDTFTRVFVDEYLKNPMLLSKDAPNFNSDLPMSVLPDALVVVFEELEEQDINIDTFRRKIIEVLTGNTMSLTAKKDDRYLYINIASKYLTDFTTAEKVIVYKALKEHFETTKSTLHYRTAKKQVKASSVRIPL